MRRFSAAAALVLSLCLLICAAQPAFAAIGGNQAPLIDNRGIEGWPTDKAPGLNCVSAFAIEAQSGTAVFSKDGDRVMHPASVTKVLTALVVIEHCDLDEMVSIEKEDVDYLEVGGNNYEMKWKGERLTVRDCLYALLLNSVNECGMALARHAGGSVSAFCDMMNEKAASLGCTNTHFTNPHGLNDEAHVTTARDMVLIYRACLQNEVFYEIGTTLRYKIEGTQLNPNGMTCYMHDRMMRPDSEYYNEYVKAGKTGYTSICGNTLVTYAEKDGKQVIICVLKGNSSANTYADTRNIMNYAFDNFTLVDLAQQTQEFVQDLTTRDNRKLGFNGNAKLLVPNALVDSLRLRYEPVSGSTDGTVGTIFYHANDSVLSTVRVMDLGPKETKVQPQSQAPQGTGSAEGTTSAVPGSKEGSAGAGDIALKVLLFVAAAVVLVCLIWVIGRFINHRKWEKERRQRREARRNARRAREEEMRRRSAAEQAAGKESLEPTEDDGSKEG